MGVLPLLMLVENCMAGFCRLAGYARMHMCIAHHDFKAAAMSQ